MNADNDMKVFTERLVNAQDDLLAFVTALMPFETDDVPDVVQDTNVALIQHAGEYDLSRPFHPWMRTFAKKQVAALHHRAKQSKLCFDSDALDQCEAAANEEPENEEPMLKRLAVCKRKLTQKQNELLHLRYEMRLSVREMEQSLKNTGQNIRSQLVYVRQKLADCVRRLCRLSDAEFERANPDLFGQGLSNVLDGDATTEQRAEFLRMVSADGTAMRRYYDQISVHAILNKYSRPATKRQVAAWRVPFVLAASLAFLFGGAFAFYKTNTAKETAKPSFVTVSSPPQENAGKEYPQQAVVAPVPVAFAQPSPQKEKEKPAENTLFLPPAISLSRDTKEPEPASRSQNQKENAEMKTGTLLATAALAVTAPTATVLAQNGAFLSGTPVRVNVSPESSMFWQSLGKGRDTVSWEWPKSADNAKLAYSGMGTSVSVPIADTNITAYTFTLPKNAKEERIYDLVLTFYAGETEVSKETARLGLVRGMNGDGAVFIAPDDTQHWQKVNRSAVLPVDASVTSVTLDNAVYPCGGILSWFGLYPVKPGTHTILNNAAGTAVTLVRVNEGTVVYLK